MEIQQVILLQDTGPPLSRSLARVRSETPKKKVAEKTMDYDGL